MSKRELCGQETEVSGRVVGCVICGATFITLHATKKTCSVECGRKLNRQLRTQWQIREYRKQHPLVEKTCRHCGRTFQTGRQSSEYCSPECWTAAYWSSTEGKMRKAAKDHRYSTSAKGRERIRVRARTTYPARRFKHLARTKARKKLLSDPCEICGTTRTEAHHEDYAQPLAVRWLCKACHLRLHGKVLRYVQR